MERQLKRISYIFKLVYWFMYRIYLYVYLFILSKRETNKYWQYQMFTEVEFKKARAENRKPSPENILEMSMYVRKRGFVRKDYELLEKYEQLIQIKKELLTYKIELLEDMYHYIGLHIVYLMGYINYAYKSKDEYHPYMFYRISPHIHFDPNVNSKNIRKNEDVEE